MLIKLMRGNKMSVKNITMSEDAAKWLKMGGRNRDYSVCTNGNST